MQAMVLRQYGGPDVLEPDELPDPNPGRDEVLIQLEASAVNPIDLGVRRGDVLPDEPSRFPMVLGWDGVGSVVGSGPRSDPHESDELPVGTRVLCMSAQPASGVGLHAELAALPRDRVVPLPDALSAQTAAALPLAGITALDGLDALSLSPGDRLLVNGDPGAAVGSFARAIAASRGAIVVDSDDGLPVDAALDVRGRDEAQRTIERVVDGGRYATVVPAFWKPGGPFTERRGIDPIVVENAVTASKLRTLVSLALEGTIVPRVQSTWSLDELAEAHRALERPGVHGRHVLVH